MAVIDSCGRFSYGGRKIRIGHVSPRTGPLAGFAEADEYVLQGIEAALAGGIDEELTEYLQYEADMCLKAKERLMEAETDEAFDVAMRRVQFLCDD